MDQDSFIDQLMRPLFEVLDETSHVGHCIMSARVLDLVFSEVGVNSIPVCVDYVVMNPTASRHVRSGGSLDSLPNGGHIASTGTGHSDMYDHHVVTLVSSERVATLIDPSIIRVQLTLKDVDMRMIVMDDLPYPPPSQKMLEVNDCIVIYTFRPEITDFTENEQWNRELAKDKASKVLNRLGVYRSGH